MKIAVISDTHMPKRAKKLPTNLIKGLVDVDLILHIGDWQSLDVYKELSQYAPVEGVFGNVDEEDILYMFDKKKIIDLDSVIIGMIHGDGKTKTTEKRAVEAFAYEDVDIILFGHSHIPVLKMQEDILLFNPGSPTDKRRQPHFSYGIITINETVTLEHIFF